MSRLLVFKPNVQHSYCQRSNLELVYQKLLNENLDVSWISDEEIFQIVSPTDNFYIIEPFSGPTFQHLKNINVHVFGPPCILGSLSSDTSIPVVNYPIYAVSMRNMFITTSGVKKQIREDIFQKIQLMGGKTDNQFVEITTHLVCDISGTEKYLTAVERNIPIYTSDWIIEVWNMCQKNICWAQDEQFNKYKCPLFKSLFFTTTGISSQDRLNIQSKIEQNGGKFTPHLTSECTHLLCEKPEGEKYTFAKQRHLRIVKCQWLFDCVNKKRFMNEKDYIVSDNERLKTLTSNSSPAEQNRLTKQLNTNDIGLSSISPYDNLSDTLSINNNLYSTATTLTTMTVQTQQSHLATQPSSALNSDITITTNSILPSNNTSLTDTTEKATITVVKQVQSTAANTTISKPFFSLSFILLNFSQKYDIDRLHKIIADNGGCVCEDKHESFNYCVCPLTLTSFDRQLVEDIIYGKMVTTYWIFSCIESKQLLSLKIHFLYRPFCLNDKIQRKEFQLKDCVISISGFNGMEKNSLAYLCQEVLGAHMQDAFVRKDVKTYKGNTHLISKEPKGQKYQAAVNWNIPTVVSEWLFDICLNGQKANEQNYQIKQWTEEKKVEFINKYNQQQADMLNEHQQQQQQIFDIVPLQTNSKITVIPCDERQLEQFEEENNNPIDMSVTTVSTTSHVFAKTSSYDKLWQKYLQTYRDNLETSEDQKRESSPKPLTPLNAVGQRVIHQAIGKLKDMDIENNNSNDDENTSCDSQLQFYSVDNGQNTDQYQMKNSNKPLQNIIIYVSKKLAKNKFSLHAQCTVLGGKFVWIPHEKFTHFIFQGKLSEIQKEYKKVEEYKAFCVSPYWLQACEDTGQHVPENLYLCNYNPNRSLTFCQNEAQACDIDLPSTPTTLINTKTTTSLQISSTQRLPNISNRTSTIYSKRSVNLITPRPIQKTRSHDVSTKHSSQLLSTPHLLLEEKPSFMDILKLKDEKRSGEVSSLNNQQQDDDDAAFSEQLLNDLQSSVAKLMSTAPTANNSVRVKINTTVIDDALQTKTKVPHHHHLLSRGRTRNSSYNSNSHDMSSENKHPCDSIRIEWLDETARAERKKINDEIENEQRVKYDSNSKTKQVSINKRGYEATTTTTNTAHQLTPLTPTASSVAKKTRS
ncbi:unnamed protein product [Didymodactylos carnosus]|uniref:BRCT domain-containing protein n=1 Tax=Didymodactylos carnosus TaxID=1234261 RepID=A0A814ZRW6_9BILA|nr:unnamed protein product [Didymodactylos carnosus]CAF4017588.1 unnamed protein product [Didymodactylos carnosus]